MTITSNAEIADAPRTIYCTADHFLINSAIQSAGHGFVVAWDEHSEFSYFHDPYDTVNASRLGPHLEVVDRNPILVSPPSTVARQPSMMRTTQGATIGYARLTDSTYGDVSRLFARDLAAAAPTRTRAVRH